MSQTVPGVKAENRIGILAHGVGAVYISLSTINYKYYYESVFLAGIKLLCELG